VLLLHKRRLGRTNLKVSQVGFGGTWISELKQEEAKKVIQRAFDLGITYFDTAKLDGDSEEKIGAALKNVRDDCVIATKTASRTRRESLADIEESLLRLQTDRVDIIQLHGIDDEKTLRKAMSQNGVLQTCKEARRKSFADFIGISSHKPRVLMEAIKTGEFDTVLLPLNLVTRQAEEELLDVAKKFDVGIVVMKPFSAKTSRLITCLFDPSLSLLSNEPEIRAWLGQETGLRVRSALRYVLSKEISVTIPGLKSINEVEIAAKIGEEYSGLSAEEQKLFEVSLSRRYCRDCGECLPCPKGIDIAAVLRFKTLAEDYGLEGWAKKLYDNLEVKYPECNRCGQCESKCPYAIKIEHELQNAHSRLHSQ
jgi:predicted aldo/keto reductase-like oxidoreductase